MSRSTPSRSCTPPHRDPLRPFAADPRRTLVASRDPRASRTPRRRARTPPPRSAAPPPRTRPTYPDATSPPLCGTRFESRARPRPGHAERAIQRAPGFPRPRPRFRPRKRRVFASSSERARAASLVAASSSRVPRRRLERSAARDPRRRPRDFPARLSPPRVVSSRPRPTDVWRCTRRGQPRRPRAFATRLSRRPRRRT